MARRLLDDVVSASVATRRFQTTLVALFAIVALALAAVGVYGVTTYAVTRRTHEFGVRLALGAGRSRVLGTVFIRGLKPVALGLAVGLVAAALAARVIRSFFFGIGPLDPTSLAAASGVLLVAALLACTCRQDGRPASIRLSHFVVNDCVDAETPGYRSVLNFAARSSALIASAHFHAVS